MFKVFAITALLATAPAVAGEIGYDKNALGFEAMMDGDWSRAEAQLAASETKLANDPARLLQLAELYRATDREAEADALYRQVLASDDMVLVLGDGRTVSAHNLAGTRLATQMQAAR
ncbi:MAG: hypothetical protein WA906_00315 [Pacificimonas sp.]